MQKEIIILHILKRFNILFVTTLFYQKDISYTVLARALQTLSYWVQGTQGVLHVPALYCRLQKLHIDALACCALRHLYGRYVDLLINNGRSGFLLIADERG